MRNVILPAIVVFCTAGIGVAKALPASVASLPACRAPSANSRVSVCPEIAALQAEERCARARGDEAAVREFERQVQAILIRQQNVVPQSAPASVVRPPRSEGSFTADQLIHRGPITAFSADWEMDGTMWAAFADASDSTIYVYKSVDHGMSWDVLFGYYLGSPHAISKIEMVVGEGDSGFVYLLENLPFNNGDLAVERLAKDGSSINAFYCRAGADTITDFTACRDFSGDDYWLYAVVHNGARPGPSPVSTFLRSTDYGKTWAVTDTTYNAARPRMAFGAGRYGYLSAVPDQSRWPGWAVAGVTTAWSSPGTWHFNDFLPDTFWINDACIAPAFTSPPESAIVWIAYSHNYNGTPDWDVLSVYALGDTQLLWNGPYAIAATSSLEGYVDLKNYSSDGNPYVNASYVNMDTADQHNNAWLGYSSSGSPTVWTALSSPWVNQAVYSSSGFSTSPRIVYSPGSPGSGGGLVFSSWESEPNVNGYFNAPWFSGVAETAVRPERSVAFSVQPSVARGPVRVSWNGSATRLAVTDVAGRVVRSVSAPAGNSFVWDGKVPSGIYLVCLRTSSGTAARPVVIQ